MSGAASAKRAEPSAAHPRPWWHRASPGTATLDDAEDATIDALPKEGRDKLAAIWQKRGDSELRVAAGFAAIVAELFESGAAPPVLQVVAKAVSDEIRHAEISVGLAARYRGDAARWPAPATSHIPAFAPTKGSLRAALHMIAMCCINETVACAVLEAAIAKASSPLVRAGLQSILTDEIDHARAGWAHLASPWVTPEAKRELGPWLLRLHSAKLRELVEEESPLPGEAFPSHGMLGRAETRRIVEATLDEVIFPGFERAGIDTAQVRDWARGAF